MGSRIKKILKKKRQQIVYAMTGITLIIVIISTVYTVRRTYIEINEGGAVPAMADVPASPKPPEEIVMSAALEAQDNNSEEIKEKVKEEEIFTFLQGPKSWEERRDWSGAWGRAFYDGGSFGGFGCGLCCLANVYSTESRYQCTLLICTNLPKETLDMMGVGQSHGTIWILYWISLVLTAALGLSHRITRTSRSRYQLHHVA